MNAIETKGGFKKEINGEMAEFSLCEKGLTIIREKHKDLFISYEDLIAKAENQLTMPI